MEVYNLMIGNDGWSSSELFDTFEKARDYAQKLEDGQSKIEGNSVKFKFHYSKHDLICPPFHVYGDMVYCSFMRSEFGKRESDMWRIIYKQKVK